MSFLDVLFQAARALRTTGKDVDVSAAAPPTPGQLLAAVDAEHAHWQDPATAGIDATARAAAAAAQTTANTAVTNAATAQSTANSATSAAATAQSTANAAGTAAAAAQSTANAAVPKTLYDANTILIATVDDTPAPLTVGASTIVGRKASGDIAALTPTESKVILSLDQLTNDAQTKAAINTAYSAKSPVVGADVVYVGDSASSYVIKKATLSDLASLLQQSTGNPYIDIPASPNAFDDEFLAGSNPDLSLRPNAYTVKNANTGATLTRSGNIDPWNTSGPAGNTYWSTIIGSWLYIQGPVNVQLDIFKTVSLSAGDTYFMRMGGTFHFATTTNGRYNELGFYGPGANGLDNNNRVYITLRDDTVAANYLTFDMARFTAGSIGSVTTRIELGHYDICGMRFDSGTTHYPFRVSSNGGQIVTAQVTGAPSTATLTLVGFRNLFSNSTSAVPQVWAIDYIRKKTSNAWIIQ